MESLPLEAHTLLAIGALKSAVIGLSGCLLPFRPLPLDGSCVSYVAYRVSPHEGLYTNSSWLSIHTISIGFYFLN